MLSHPLRTSLSLSVVALLLAMAGCGDGFTSQSPPVPPPRPVPFRTEVFLSSLNFPVTIAFAPDGSLFFNELDTGRVRIIQNGVLQAQPFATLPVQTDGERGLLGLLIPSSPATGSSTSTTPIHQEYTAWCASRRLTVWDRTLP